MRFVLFSGLWLLASSLTYAQSSILDQYVAEGMRSNLALKQQDVLVEKSFRALDEARGWFMPSLELNARYSRAAGGRMIDFPIGDLLNPVYQTLNQMTDSRSFPTVSNASVPFLRPEEHETKLRFVQPILQPSILYNYQIKQTQVGMQKNSLDAYKRQLEADIRTSYYNYLKTVKVIALYEKVKELQHQNIRLSQKLLDNDKITYDVIYAAKADLSDTELKMSEAEKNQRLASAYFNFLLNRPLDSPIESDTTFTLAIIPLPDVEDLSATALERREELQQVTNGIRATDQSIRLVRSNALPSLNLVVDYGFQGTKYRFTADDDFLMGSLVLSWKIFGGLQNRARISQAQLDKVRIETQFTELQNQIRLQVNTALENLKVAQQNLNTTAERLASARKYYSIVDKKYREGSALYIEYLSALTTLTNAENSRILAEYEYQTKITELNRVTAK